MLVPKGVYQHKPRETFDERLYTHLQFENDCWLWTGAVNEHGYGRLTLGRTYKRYAHRASWESSFGAIPEGLNVLHRCDTPRCINPAHLFLGTRADNVHDMDSKGRRKTAPSPEFCAKGHLYDDANTGYSHSQVRPQKWCRACKREANRKWRAG